ncbi:MAG TPA: trigger factor [Conexibacter sp.]|nr:trigger factor [Conexibacter sp.]
MASPVKTTLTELPESRVRVDAEVPAAEVEKSLAQAARRLARDTRVPGFRKGKVPPPVFIRRVGREYVLDEAIRGSIGTWYADALGEAKVVPIGEPKLDLGDLPSEGQPLSFSFEIGVRPVARLGEYLSLEVGKPEAQVDEERVAHELEHLREHLARLETVERAAEQNDFVVVDYKGSIDGELFEGGEGHDQLIELGGGRLIPGFEEQLVGASAGDERTIDVTFPDDYGADHLAGRPAQFAISVKEVRARVLPELDDELAADAAGFDTLDELREDIRGRIAEQADREADAEFREAVLDAAVANATVTVPDALVEARAVELWDQMLHSLSHRGLSKEAYLQISGRTETEILDEAKPDAERALKREAVLAAVVAAESIEPTDEELAEALSSTAEREGTRPEKLLERVRKAGSLDALREDVATRKAMDLLAERAKPISPEKAAARERLWVPDSATGERRPARAARRAARPAARRADRGVARGRARAAARGRARPAARRA